MNGNEKARIDEIAKHVAVLNDEVGKLQSDVRWLKRILGYISVIITGVLIAVVGAVVN